MTEDEKKAAKYRQEAKTGGTDAPVPQSVIQEAADKKAQEKAKQAPTTKTEMGKGFAKGGSTSKTPQFKVPIQQLPYMGEKPESRIPPPAQRSKTNSDVKIPDKNYKNGGMTASSRADGCAQRGKTRGKIIK
jgi:hypothetical protein